MMSTTADSTAIPMSGTHPPVQVIGTGPSFTIREACEMITHRYNKKFEQLKMILPGQFVDGAVADFVDCATNESVATCRFRIINGLHVDPVTSNMQLDVKLSDLTFQHSTLTVDMR